ncbi:MAG: Fur family transcriptional regulator [Chloroflexota bacterium]
MGETGVVFNEAGRRATGQRLLLLELIREAGGHVDADELYRLARERFPRMSLSTVYRNLQLFKRLGLVEDHDFSESHRHYEAKPPREHQHLLCQQCGRIVEFSSPLIAKMKKQMEGEQGFTIKGADVHLVGLCPSCRDRSEAGVE